MTPDLVEKCARAAAVSTGIRPARIDDVWPHYVGQALAVIDALADGVTDEMGGAFDAAHVAYWDKHWVSSQDLNFSKTRKAANRIALSAAIRAAKGRQG